MLCRVSSLLFWFPCGPVPRLIIDSLSQDTILFNMFSMLIKMNTVSKHQKLACFFFFYHSDFYIHCVYAHLRIYFAYVCIYVKTHTCLLWHTCRALRTTCESLFLPSTLFVGGVSFFSATMLCACLWASSQFCCFCLLSCHRSVEITNECHHIQLFTWGHGDKLRWSGLYSKCFSSLSHLPGLQKTRWVERSSIHLFPQDPWKDHSEWSVVVLQYLPGSLFFYWSGVHSWDYFRGINEIKKQRTRKIVKESCQWSMVGLGSYSGWEMMKVADRVRCGSSCLQP